MKKLFILIVPVILSGCASTFNIGESEYSCRGYPEDSKCISAREIYAQTHDKDYLVGYVGEGEEEQQKASNTESKSAISDREPIKTAVPRLEKPLPIRSTAKVMRVYIGPWEDKQGDLNSPGYVFTEVIGRRWTIGAGQTQFDVPLSPLQVLKEEGIAKSAKKN